MPQHPKSLKNNPIIEAIFEVHFKSEIENVRNILPGILYEKFRKDFPKIEQLPNGYLPKEILEQNPDLVYQVTHRLHGQFYIIGLGEHVFSLNNIRPYQGWDNFSSKIKELITVLQQTQLINQIEQVSLKYLNLLAHETHSNLLTGLNVTVQLAELNLENFNLQTEIKQNDITTVVQIIPNTMLISNVNNEINKGLLLDISSHLKTVDNNDFWNNPLNLLDRLHQVQKDLFFKMLKKELVQYFGVNEE